MIWVKHQRQYFWGVFKENPLLLYIMKLIKLKGSEILFSQAERAVSILHSPGIFMDELQSVPFPTQQRPCHCSEVLIYADN